MRRDVVRVLLIAALAVLISGAVFSAVCTIIWPVHWPEWAARVSAAGLLGGILLTACGASLWAVRKGR